MKTTKFIKLITLFSLITTVQSPVSIEAYSMNGEPLKQFQLSQSKQEVIGRYFKKIGTITSANEDGIRVLGRKLNLFPVQIQGITLVNESELVSNNEILRINLVKSTKQVIVCQTNVDIRSIEHSRSFDGEVSQKTAWIGLNGINIYKNPIVDEEDWLYGGDGERTFSSVMYARSTMAVTNLLLGQFFGKPDDYNPSAKHEQGIPREFDYTSTIQIQRIKSPFHEIECSAQYNPEYHIKEPEESIGSGGSQTSKRATIFQLQEKTLYELIKFLGRKTEAVLPRIRADLYEEHINEYECDYRLPDLGSQYAANELTQLEWPQYFPKLELIPESLAELGIDQSKIKYAADYIPITAIISYHTKNPASLAFFAHKPNGRAKLIFYVDDLSLTRFLQRWHRYFNTETGEYFEDDPEYKSDKVQKFLALLEHYLEAPVYVEYDPFKQIIPRSLHSWALGDDRIPPAGVILNRITFDNLISLFEKLFEYDDVVHNVTVPDLESMFCPDEVMTEPSERTSSEYGSDSEEEKETDDGETHAPTSLCGYQTDDDGPEW